jgi:hypothetical protein
MKTSLTPRLAGMFAAVALAALSAAPVTLAAPAAKMAHSKKMAHGKKMAAHTVYVCTKCKAFYSPTMAKKMGYKDGMGHMLVKEAKTPAGYMDGSKMKM